MTTEAIRLNDRNQTRPNHVAPSDVQVCRELFAEQGYLVFRGVVAREALGRLKARVLAEFEQARRNGSLFAGGGLVSGHLNCFPGEESRFVYEALEQCGIFELVRALAGKPLGLPNIGCNLNLPDSKPQNHHVDGYAAEPFMVVNVAAVDTDLVNGALEILEGTHDRRYKYWELVLADPPCLRLPMRQGDVLIRTSVLWHRGMPNRSPEPRPMLAFTWEHGGSALADPYSANGGKIAFYPNRYGTNLSGKLRERAFTAAPALGSTYRFIRSLLEER